MAESAALLVDEVFPEQPIRQWVLSFPYPLRFLFASRPGVMGEVLGLVYRCIATHLIRKAGFTRKTARTGAVTLMMCRDARMPRSAGMRESGPAIWVGAQSQHPLSYAVSRRGVCRAR
jgi:hypothetical protein